MQFCAKRQQGLWCLSVLPKDSSSIYFSNGKLVQFVNKVCASRGKKCTILMPTNMRDAYLATSYFALP